MTGIQLALLRHGPTLWNVEKRLQGHTDTKLSAEGRALVTRYRLPDVIQSCRVYCSPLLRARETAALALPGRAVTVAPELIETDLGNWEGQRLPDLRARLGAEMAANEARGLDFTAPGGESPRMVQQRLAPLLRRWAAAGEDVIAVTHKGVIRALYAWAAGWDMTGKSPDRLHWDALHLFRLTAEGVPVIDRLNVMLLPQKNRPEGEIHPE